MPQVTYEIVSHGSGWVDKVDGVFSEPDPRHAAAFSAAERRIPCHTQVIQYEDAEGHWLRPVHGAK
jgi:hypothetical protein